MQPAYSAEVEEKRPVRLARQERLRQLIEKTGGPKALSRIVDSPDTHLIAVAGGSKQMGDRLARKIEGKAGLPSGWMDATPQTDGPFRTSNDPGVVLGHPLSLSPFDTPLLLSWGDLMGKETLPQRFSLAVPDDALAPQTPKGTALIFETNATPMPGHGVLLEDSTGARYVRRYVPGTAGRWSAAARNDAFPTLESGRDGLRVLAVATGRMDGAV